MSAPPDVYFDVTTALLAAALWLERGDSSQAAHVLAPLYDLPLASVLSECAQLVRDLIASDDGADVVTFCQSALLRIAALERPSHG